MLVVRKRISAGPIAALFAVTTAVAAGAADAPTKIQRYPGPQYEASAQAERLAQPQPAHFDNPADRLRHWNRVAIDASGLDHTPVQPGENRVFGEQVGPGRSSRAIAIVHIAIADAVASIRGGFRRYTSVPNAPAHSSIDTAIATAAAETLAVMFPSQRSRFARLLAEDILDAPGSIQEKARGILVGHRAAAAILALRANDGSAHPESRMDIDYIPGPEPGVWRQDPISHSPVALGHHWGEVRPFVLASPAQFRVPPFPSLASPQYATAYNEVKRLGGDGLVTPTERTEDQTHIGIYWAYDGTPSLCAPPRLYNQITTKLSQNSHNVVELARLFALVNVAMADSGIAIWESKFFYKIWRPVTGIRESDTGTGPTGQGDGNDATAGDPEFSPLGAPASNLTGPNFTPPFPAYPSGHAGFGGALFQTLRRFYGTDRIRFTFVSDEFNGVTTDNQGNVRPRLPRTFATLSAAEEENGQSRIYLGIHWEFDKTEGMRQGRRVADYVMANAFQPVR
jgi:vanadium-dependent haloperoxidase-like protein